MSSWGALWAVDKPVVPVTTNPQGSLAAAVGTLAVRACDGQIYVKRGGGSTAFGWYLAPGGDQYISFQPKFVAASSQMTQNNNAQALSVNPTTIINALPSNSSVAGVPSPRRAYVGGYTSGVAGNSFLYRLSNNTDNNPSQRIDDSVASCFQEFDAWWDIFTTPRSQSGAGSTDLTTNAMRIWAGGVWGAAVVQAVGGTVSSDTLATEWPSCLTVTNNLFGWAFRWSSAIDGATWKLVTTNCVGGAYGQTVTDMLTAIDRNTAYRLRVRFLIVSGVLTCFASINDGAEIAVTANVGPTISTPVQTQPFQPLASVRQINATVKSLAAMQFAMNYGLGVGITC